MTSHELAALVGVYAIDALDEPERERFEAHLAACAECATEVASLRAAATELSHTSTSPPPAALRDGLLAAIGRVRPLPPRTGPSNQRPNPARRWLWPAIAAACALIAVVAAGWGWQQHQQLASHRLSPAALSSVFDSPDVATATVPIGTFGHATLIYSKIRQRAVLIGQRLPAPPAGKTYQLWMLAPDGTATSAGLFHPNRDGTVLIQASGDLNHTAQMGISIEQAGGASQPTPGAIVADLAI